MKNLIYLNDSIALTPAAWINWIQLTSLRKHDIYTFREIELCFIHLVETNQLPKHVRRVKVGKVTIFLYKEETLEG